MHISLHNLCIVCGVFQVVKVNLLLYRNMQYSRFFRCNVLVICDNCTYIFVSIYVRRTISPVIQLCLCTIPTESVALHVAFGLVNMLCHANTQCTGLQALR